ncbi:MAG: BrnT family toxin [Pyrinomonadaceae bacterium]
MKFTWDENKFDKVLSEHKIDFNKILDIFEDDYSLDIIDKKHSTADEIRFIVVGLTAFYGLVYLVYAMPSDNEIRFITARKAEKFYVSQYEENLRGT